MSKHPVGPWTETKLLANYVSKSTGLLCTATAPSGTVYPTYQVPPTTLVASGSDIRSGFNSSDQPRGFMFRGRLIRLRKKKVKFTTPRYASRLLTQLKCRPVVFNGSAMTPADGWKYLYSGSYYPSGVGALPGTSFTSKVTETHNAAFSKFINRQTSSLKALSVIGEGPQTMEGFKSLANSLTGAHNEGTKQLVKSLKGSRTSGLTALLSRFSDAYLGYIFAVKPTLSDIHDLYTTTRDKVLYEPLPVTKVRASAKTIDRFASLPTFSNVGNPEYRETKHAFQETIISLGASVRPECVNSFIPSLPELYGFSWGELLAAGWEVTPYSWLSDYFGNLGSVLNLLAMHRNVWTDGWYVQIERTESYVIWEPNGNFVGLGNHKNLGAAGTPGYIMKRVFSFSRSPYNVDTGGITPIMHLPSLSQASNIAALVTSRLTKSPLLTTFMSPEKARDFRNLLRSQDRPGQ